MKNIFEIMLSTACNARCPYCYEASARTSTMSLETEKAMLALIRKAAASGDPMRVVWFGGEPLLFSDRILGLHAEINNIVSGRDVPLFSLLITALTSLVPEHMVVKGSSRHIQGLANHTDTVVVLMVEPLRNLEFYGERIMRCTTASF